MKFDITSFLLGKATGGGDRVPLLTTAQWNALSTAEKQAYGLVAIQDASSGFDRGELVNGADYIPEPVMLHSGSINGAGEDSITYTAEQSAETEMLIVITSPAQGKDISDISVTKNGADITTDFSQLTVLGGNAAIVYGAGISISSGDVISVSNSEPVQYTGVQLYILEYAILADVAAVGVAGNNNSTFTIPQSRTAWYLEAAKYGYYNTNTTPTVTVFQCIDSAGTSTPCPNEQRYWYGGTFVLKIRS